MALRIIYVGGGNGKTDANAFIDPNLPVNQRPARR
jgi:hypothetical protein